MQDLREAGVDQETRNKGHMHTWEIRSQGLRFRDMDTRH